MHGFIDLYPKAGGDRLTLFTQLDLERHPTEWLRYDIPYSSITLARPAGAFVELFTNCQSEVSICCVGSGRVLEFIRSRRLRRLIGTSGYPISDLEEVQAFGVDVHRHGDAEYQARLQWLAHLDGIYGKRTGLLSEERLN